MSQLGLGLGLTRGGGVPFNPLSLDPYLLFDTRSSMIGTFENPTLDLDPSDPDTLDVITATRSGVATYTDADGLIQSASADTVRVDHVDGVPMILVEPSATNLVTYSEDFSHAAWGKSNVTLTSDYGIAPDGDNTSTRIQYLGETSYIANSVVPSDYTASAFVKGVAGQVVRFGIGANIAQGADFTLNGEWQRIEYTGSGGTIFFSAFGGNTATDFEIWGAQVEAGSVATSYIPTSGSTVTRAADDLVISGSDFSDFYNSSEGTVYIELTSEDGRNSYPVYFTQDVAGFASRNNGTWVIQKDGGSYVNLSSWANGGFVSDSYINLGTYTAGDLTRVSVSYDSNSYEGSKDGASVQTSTPTTMATTLVDRLYVGGSGIFQNSSRIKRLIYWPYSSDRL